MSNPPWYPSICRSVTAVRQRFGLSGHPDFSSRLFYPRQVSGTISILRHLGDPAVYQLLELNGSTSLLRDCLRVEFAIAGELALSIKLRMAP